MISSGLILLLDGQTVTGAGNSFQAQRTNIERPFQAVVTGSGALTAVVLVEVSNDGILWSTRMTFNLSGSNSANDIGTDSGGFLFVRGRISSISGTGAQVSLTMVS